jgi:flagellar P-ring protein FlgI
VYAVAQWPVVTGGFVSGKSSNSQTVNHPTVGRVPGGAIVERSGPTLAPSGQLKLQLRQPDFTTAVRVSEIVNKKFAGGAPLAQAQNSALIAVTIPPEFASRVTEFIAGIEALEVDVDRPAKVIVNERTGTIVMGKQVRVSPVAIMHGNLTVEIQTILQVSQPQPLAQGTTQVVPQQTATSAEEKARNLVLKEGATVEQLVQALSSIGSTPRDIIAILQSLRAAGALEADLEVI